MRKKQEAKHANKKIWKRRLLAGLIACGIFVTTGCGQVIDLTDEENHLIAEYAAELLLKYDRNYDTRYNPDELEDTTETMTETDATTEATTEVVTTTEAATTEQDAPADGQTTQAQPVTDEAVKEDIGATVDSDFDIAAFVGESRISVRYAYYMVVDSYPSYDQDGMYIEVQAPEGYKLLVLKFEVENKTNEDQAVDLYNKDVNYNIVVDNSRTTKQMLTILADDLYTYDKTIQASSREETVLLYTVSDSVANKWTDLKLQVKYGGTSAVLQLEQ
ncbi:MAG: hypothetical protein KBH72_00855 [Lachnospiraceae bacterium]|jgi:hypothetical protein|nr:hypothetical protein [Lachnospiraceae bacterium]MED9930812.1 hypothetical protein [Lachnospiraceae bacterium]